MKNRIMLLLALLVALVAPSAALAQEQILVAAPLHWDRGAGITDSTFISIPVWGGAITTATAEDTTEWFNVGDYKFPAGTGSATPVPLLQFQIGIGTVAATTTDSVGYIFQYTNDKTNATRTSGFIGGSIAYAAVSNDAVVVTAMDATRATTAMGKWVRVIIRNAEIGSGYQRRFRVTPIVHGWR